MVGPHGIARHRCPTLLGQRVVDGADRVGVEHPEHVQHLSDPTALVAHHGDGVAEHPVEFDGADDQHRVRQREHARCVVRQRTVEPVGRPLVPELRSGRDQVRPPGAAPPCRRGSSVVRQYDLAATHREGGGAPLSRLGEPRLGEGGGGTGPHALVFRPERRSPAAQVVLPAPLPACRARGAAGQQARAPVPRPSAHVRELADRRRGALEGDPSRGTWVVEPPYRRRRLRAARISLSYVTNSMSG